MKQERLNFYELVKELQSNGYTVIVEKGHLYDFARVNGNNVKGGFCSLHDKSHLDASYIYINGKIAADNENCFNKYSDCPLELSLPKNKEEMRFLIEQLEYLGTDKAAYKSNEFDLCIEEYTI